MSHSTRVNDIHPVELNSFLSKKLPNIFNEKMNLELKVLSAGVSNPPIHIKNSDGFEFVLKLESNNEYDKLQPQPQGYFGSFLVDVKEKLRILLLNVMN